MQSRAIRRLAKNMRKTHRSVKSWLKTAEHHKILDAKGLPAKSLARLIAIENFEPTEHETLIRIGMPCLCDGCKRAKRKAKKAATQDLFDMTDKAIIEALNNRQPMQTTYNKTMMAEFIKACKRKGTLVKVRATP